MVQLGCDLGAAMAVVLECNNHSFSFLPLQVPKRRLGTRGALVLILRGANSSGDPEVFVVFALSLLTPLPQWNSVT